MEEVLHLCCPSKPRLVSRLRPRRCPSLSSSSSPGRPRPRAPPVRALRSSSSSAFPTNTTLPLPKRPPKPPPPDGDDDDDDGGLPFFHPEMPPLEGAGDSTFREKVLFLDSVGVDLLAAAAAHPRLLSTPLAHLRSTTDFLLAAAGFSPADLRRICGMCPEVLTAGGPRALGPAIAFLLREAGVDGLPGLRRAVRRRPRLLVSDVATRLRPTLYFLQMLGVADAGRRHAPLLSCSVEEKLLPRIEFLQGVGFSPREARAMVRRFPQLFCYSIAGNLEPKFDFFAVEMGRGLRELRVFPQYFSFSLRGRIMPRHRRCAEAGVLLPLPALLKPADEQFQARLEVCTSSSPPLWRSPLCHKNLTSKYNTRSNSSTGGCSSL